MDINSIVDAVTQEVMKRLNCEENSCINSTPKVLILEKQNNACFKTIEEKLNFIGYEVDSIESKSDISKYDKIIITSLNNRELANIALGVECGKKEQIVLEALLHGKKVFLIEEGISYRKYAGISNKILFKLYEDYEKKLLEYGIFILNKRNFIEGFNKGKGNVEQKNNISEAEQKDVIPKNKNILELGNKKLLTEADIKKACEDGYNEINISKKTIITSLAVDCIRINGVKINKIS